MRFASLLLTIAGLVCCLATMATAVQPTLTSINPPGGQRGTEVEFTFGGARLADAQELMLYSPGVEVVDFKVEEGKRVKAKLKIAADARVGFHGVRVRSESGITNLRLFAVGTLPQIAEVEPNSDFEAPQPIALDNTIYGKIDLEDVDHFVVEAKQGERITAELEGLRLGNAMFDPYLAILNEKRFELARSDDAPLLRQDCLCSIVAPEDGKYIVQVRESAYGGDGNSKYRLHVGRFPRPTAVVPAGGKPGETLEVTWLGDAAGPRKQTVTLPSEPAGDARLFALDDHGTSPSGNGIRLSDLPGTIEAEPNNTRGQATVAVAPGAMHGVIGEAGDVDHFKFTAKKGQRFDIRTYARKTLRSPLDPLMVVRKADGGSVGSNDDTGGPDSYFRFTAPADGEYFIELRDHLRSGGPDYAYRIEVAPIKPALSLSLPEKVRYEAVTLSVPRGNRMALMVNAARQNFGGALNVRLEGAPQGLAFETFTMADNRNEVPVLFTAAADAPIAGTLADLQAKPVDENLKLVGHLNQRTMLVRGQNNRDVYGHNADRMATAITKEVPFKIDIVQPKAPLVRSGSMGLKVVATRNEGFTAPIAIRMLYNPPGVGSSGSVSIPEGKNEAVIPITANGAASMGTWKVVVLGSAAHAGGRVEVATQLADLEIADNFFNLAVGKTAVELGKTTQLPVTIEKKRDFEGTAKIQLLGLPANTAAEPMEFTKDSTEVIFTVTTNEKARAGRFKNLLARAVVTVEGEPVTQTLGSGELRVDKPLPPKVAAAPKPATEAKPEPAKPAAPKPLSRLEQLRQAKAGN